MHESLRACVAPSAVPVWSRTFAVREWPRGGAAWWAMLLHLPVAVRVRFTAVPSAFRWSGAMQRRLRRLLTSVEMQQASDRAAAARPEEVLAARAIRAIRDALLYRGLQAVDVWAFITVMSDSPENLEADCARVLGALRARGIEAEPVDLCHGPGAALTLPAGPLGLDGLEWVTPRTGVVRAAAPAVPADAGRAGDWKGVYVGHDPSGVPVLLDFRREDVELNANAVVLGASGEGKSTWLKAVAVAGALLDGWHVVVFDVDGEYRALCDALGGVWVDLSGSSGRFPDPCRLPPPSGDPQEDAGRYDRMLAHVSLTFAVLLEGASEAEKAVVEQEARALLEGAGVRREDPSTWDDARLADAGFSLRAIYERVRDRAAGGDPWAGSVAQKLWRYFDGSLRGLFEDPLPVGEMPGRLTVLHLGNPNASARDARGVAVRYALAVQAVWEWLRQNRARGRWTMVVVDEGQRVMENPVLAPNLADLCTAIRKWRGCLVLATNAPAALWKGGHGDAVWANTAVKVIFWLEDDQLDALRHRADIPDPVVAAVRRQHGTRTACARVGPQRWVQVRLDLPPEELELYRTRR